MNRSRATALAVAVTGLLAAAAVASRASMPRSDFAELVAWATGTAAAGGLVLGASLQLARRRSVTLQIALLMLGTAAVLATGAWLGARAMFFSDHDTTALAVLLLATGGVGCAVALVTGARFAREIELVSVAARRLGEGQPPRVDGSVASADMARLSADLETTAATLEEARALTEAVERSRRELVAWVSHDLRTPLAGIRAIAEALEDGIAADGEAAQRFYTMLRHESERLGELIDDLFELSRAQAGVLRLEMERLSLPDLVSDAIAGVSPVAERKGVRVVGHVASSAELNGSAPELLRALRNILENAVRHTPADGSIVVEAGQDQMGAYVSVLDDGGGVPDDALARVFDVGFRADEARSPGGGAGLGLAIARSLVEAHHGRITVCNENGGARFTVWLPLEQVDR